MAALDNQSTPKQSRSSLSTLLLLSGGGIAVALLLVMIPMQLLASEERLTRLQQLQCIVGCGAGVWAGLLVVASAGLNRRSRNLALAQTLPLPSGYGDLRTVVEAVIATSRRKVAVFLTGAPAALVDDGRGLLLGPETIESDSEAVILIPPMFWLRFQGHPLALSAVLAHEVAHVNRRDLTLMFGLRRILLAVLPVALVYVAIALTASAVVDCHGGGAVDLWPAFFAAFIGKNFLIVLILLALAAGALAERLAYWREALADLHAVESFGEVALDEAESLMQGKESEEMGLRPRRADVKRALALSPYDTLLFGFAATALAQYVSGELTFVGQLVRVAHPAMAVTLMTAADAAHDVLLGGAFACALLIVANSLPQEGRFLVVPYLLIVSTVASRLILQAMPLALVSVAMPAGYEAPHQADVPSLLCASAAGAVLTATNAILIAGCCPLVWRGRHRAWTLFPWLLWSVIAAVETRYMPAAARGLLAPTLTLLAVTVLFGALLRGRRVPAASRAIWLLPLYLVSLVGWLGAAEDSHIGECRRVESVRALIDGDIAHAVSASRSAVRFAPLTAPPWIAYARALLAAKDLNAATRAADSAAAAPYSSEYSERVEALELAGTLHLERSRQPGMGAEVSRAQRFLEDVDRRWERDSHLPCATVANALYNLACARSIRSADSPNPGAFVDTAVALIEVFSLSPRLAHQASIDQDLVAWRRASPARPPDEHEMAIRRVSAQSPLGAAFRSAYERHELTVNDILGTSAALIDAELPPGANEACR